MLRTCVLAHTKITKIFDISNFLSAFFRTIFHRKRLKLLSPVQTWIRSRSSYRMPTSNQSDVLLFIIYFSCLTYTTSTILYIPCLHTTANREESHNFLCQVPNAPTLRFVFERFPDLPHKLLSGNSAPTCWQRQDGGD